MAVEIKDQLIQEQLDVLKGIYHASDDGGYLLNEDLEPTKIPEEQFLDAIKLVSVSSPDEVLVSSQNNSSISKHIEAFLQLHGLNFSVDAPLVQHSLASLYQEGILVQGIQPEEVINKINLYFKNIIGNSESGFDISKINTDAFAQFSSYCMAGALVQQGQNIESVSRDFSLVVTKNVFNETNYLINYKLPDKEITCSVFNDFSDIQDSTNTKIVAERKTDLTSLGIYAGPMPFQFSSPVKVKQDEDETIGSPPIVTATPPVVTTTPPVVTATPPVVTATPPVVTATPPVVTTATPPVTMAPGKTNPSKPVYNFDNVNLVFGGIIQNIDNAGDYIDKNLDIFLKRLSENPEYYTHKENDFYVTDTKRLMSDLQGLINAFQVLAAMVNLANMCVDAIENAALQLLELDPNEFSTAKDRQKLADNWNKLSQKAIEACQTFINMFYQWIDAKNKEIYEKKKKKIEKDASGFWKAVGNFFSGNAYEKQKEKELKELAKKMSDIHDEMIKSYAQVQAMLMQNTLLDLSSTGLGDPAKFKDLQKQFEEDIRKVFTTDLTRVTSDAGYISLNDKVFVAGYTALQKLFAVMRAIMMAKQAQLNSIRQAAQQLTDYAGSSGDVVDSANNFLEVRMNLVTQTMLRVFSLTQAKISYYNEYIQHKINEEKLAKRQWSAILSTFTLGILAPIDNLNNALIEQNTPQKANTNQTQFSDVYDWLNMFFQTSSDSSQAPGVKALNRLHEQERELLMQMYSLQSNLVNVGGGRKAVNWGLYAQLQNQLKRIQEAQRAIFKAIQAALDSIETAAADLAEKPKQHLYKQLDQFLESQFQLTQMVLDVLKFQLQMTQWAYFLNAQVDENRWNAWFSFGMSFLGLPGRLVSNIISYYANPYSAGNIDEKKLQEAKYNYTGSDALPPHLKDKNPNDPEVEQWAREQWAKQHPGEPLPTGQTWQAWKSETFWNAQAESELQDFYNSDLTDTGGSTWFMGVSEKGVDYKAFFKAAQRLNQIMIRRMMLAMAEQFIYSTLSAMIAYLKGREAAANVFSEYMVDIADRISQNDFDALSTIFTLKQTEATLSSMKFQAAVKADKDIFKLVVIACALIIPGYGPLIAALALFTPMTDMIYNGIQGNSGNKYDDQIKNLRDYIQKLKQEGKWSEDDEILYNLIISKMTHSFNDDDFWGNAADAFGCGGSYVDWSLEIDALIKTNFLFNKRNALANVFEAVQDTYEDVAQELGGMSTRSSLKGIKDTAQLQKSNTEAIINSIMSLAQAKVSRDMSLMQFRRALLTDTISLAVEIAAIVAVVLTGGAAAAGLGEMAAAEAEATASGASEAGSAAKPPAEEPKTEVLPLNAPPPPVATVTTPGVQADVSRMMMQSVEDTANVAQRPVQVPVESGPPVSEPVETSVPGESVSEPSPSTAEGEPVAETAPKTAPSVTEGAKTTPQETSPKTEKTSEKKGTARTTARKILYFLGDKLRENLDKILNAIILSMYADKVASMGDKEDRYASKKVQMADQGQKAYTKTEADMYASKYQAANFQLSSNFFSIAAQVNAEVAQMIGQMIQEIAKSVLKNIKSLRKKDGTFAKNVGQEMMKKASKATSLKTFMPDIKSGLSKLTAGWDNVSTKTPSIANMGRTVGAALSQSFLNRSDAASRVGISKELISGTFRAGIEEARARIKDPATLLKFNELSADLETRIQTLQNLESGDFHAEIARLDREIAQVESRIKALEMQPPPAVVAQGALPTVPVSKSTPGIPSGTPAPASSTVVPAQVTAPLDAETTHEIAELKSKLTALNASITEMGRLQTLGENVEQEQLAKYFETATDIVDTIGEMQKVAAETESPSKFKQFFKGLITPGPLSLFNNPSYLRDLKKNLATGYATTISSIFMAAGPTELAGDVKASLAGSFNRLVGESQQSRHILSEIGHELSLLSEQDPEAFSKVMENMLHDGNRQVQDMALKVMLGTKDIGPRTCLKLLLRGAGLNNSEGIAQLSQAERVKRAGKLLELETRMNELGLEGFGEAEGVRKVYDIVNMGGIKKGFGSEGSELRKCSDLATQLMIANHSDSYSSLMTSVTSESRSREIDMRNQIAQGQTPGGVTSAVGMRHVHGMVNLLRAMLLPGQNIGLRTFAEQTLNAGGLGARIHRSSRWLSFGFGTSEADLPDRTFRKRDLQAERTGFKKDYLALSQKEGPISTRTNTASTAKLLEDYGIRRAEIGQDMGEIVNQTLKEQKAMVKALDKTFQQMEALPELERTEEKFKSQLEENLKKELEDQGLEFNPQIMSQKTIASQWQNFTQFMQAPHATTQHYFTADKQAQVLESAVEEQFEDMAVRSRFVSDINVALGFADNYQESIISMINKNSELTAQQLKTDSNFKRELQSLFTSLQTGITDDPTKASEIGQKVKRLDNIVQNLTGENLTSLIGADVQSLYDTCDRITDGKMAKNFTELSEMADSIAQPEEAVAIKKDLAEISKTIDLISPTDSTTITSAKTAASEKIKGLLAKFNLPPTAENVANIKKILNEKDPGKRAELIKDFLHSDNLKTLTPAQKLFMRNLLEVTSATFDLAEITSDLASTDISVRQKAVVRLNTTSIDTSLFEELKQHDKLKDLFLGQNGDKPKIDAQLFQKLSFSDKLATLIEQGKKITAPQLEEVFHDLVELDLVKKEDLAKYCDETAKGIKPTTTKENSPIEHFVHDSYQLADEIREANDETKKTDQQQQHLDNLSGIINDSGNRGKSQFLSQLLSKMDPENSGKLLQRLMNKASRDLEARAIREDQTKQIIAQFWEAFLNQIRSNGEKKLKELLSKTDPAFESKQRAVYDRVKKMLPEFFADLFKKEKDDTTIAEFMQNVIQQDSSPKIKALNETHVRSLLLAPTNEKFIEVCESLGLTDQADKDRIKDLIKKTFAGKDLIDTIRKADVQAFGKLTDDQIQSLVSAKDETEFNNICTSLNIQDDAKKTELSEAIENWRTAKLKTLLTADEKDFQEEVKTLNISQKVKDDLMNLRQNSNAGIVLDTYKPQVDDLIKSAMKKMELSDSQSDLFTILVTTPADKLDSVLKKHKLADKKELIIKERQAFEEKLAKIETELADEMKKELLSEEMFTDIFKTLNVPDSKSLRDAIKKHIETEYTKAIMLNSKLTMSMMLADQPNISYDTKKMLADSVYQMILKERTPEGLPKPVDKLETEATAIESLIKVDLEEKGLWVSAQTMLEKHVFSGFLRDHINSVIEKGLTENKSSSDIVTDVQKELRKYNEVVLTSKEEEELLKKISDRRMLPLSFEEKAKAITRDTMMFREKKIVQDIVNDPSLKIDPNFVFSLINKMSDHNAKTRLLAGLLRNLESELDLTGDTRSLNETMGIIQNYLASDPANFAILSQAFTAEICPKLMASLKPELKQKMLESLPGNTQTQYILYNILFADIAEQRLGIARFKFPQGIKTVTDLFQFLDVNKPETFAQLTQLVPAILNAENQQDVQGLIQNLLDPGNVKILMSKLTARLDASANTPENKAKLKAYLDVFSYQLFSLGLLTSKDTRLQIKKVLDGINSQLANTVLNSKDQAEMKDLLIFYQSALSEQVIDENYQAEKLSLSLIRKELTDLIQNSLSPERKKASLNKILSSLNSLIQLSPDSKEKTEALKLLVGLRKEIQSLNPDVRKVLSKLRNSAGLLNQASQSKLISLDESLSVIIRNEAMDIFRQNIGYSKELTLKALIEMAGNQPQFASEIFDLFFQDGHLSDQYKKLIGDGEPLIAGFTKLFDLLNKTGNPAMKKVMGDLLLQIKGLEETENDEIDFTAFIADQSLNLEQAYIARTADFYQQYLSGNSSFEEFIDQVSDLVKLVKPGFDTKMLNDLKQNPDLIMQSAYLDPLKEIKDLIIKAIAVKKARETSLNADQVNKVLLQELNKLEQAFIGIDAQPDSAKSLVQKLQEKQMAVTKAIEDIRKRIPSVPLEALTRIFQTINLDKPEKVLRKFTDQLNRIKAGGALPARADGSVFNIDIATKEIQTQLDGVFTEIRKINQDSSKTRQQKEIDKQKLILATIEKIIQKIPELESIKDVLPGFFDTDLFQDRENYRQVVADLKELLNSADLRKANIKMTIENLIDLTTNKSPELLKAIYQDSLSQLTREEKQELLSQLVKLQPGNTEEAQLKLGMIETMIEQDFTVFRDFCLNSSPEDQAELKILIQNSRASVKRAFEKNLQISKSSAEYNLNLKFLNFLASQNKEVLAGLALSKEEMEQLVVNSNEQEIKQFLSFLAKEHSVMAKKILNSIINNRTRILETLFEKNEKAEYQYPEIVDLISQLLANREMETRLPDYLLKRIICENLMADQAKITAKPDTPIQELLGAKLFKTLILESSESVNEWLDYLSNPEMFRQVLVQALSVKERVAYNEAKEKPEKEGDVAKAEVLARNYPQYHPEALPNLTKLISSLNEKERFKVITGIKSARTLEMVLTQFSSNPIIQAEIEKIYAENPHLLLILSEVTDKTPLTLALLTKIMKSESLAGDIVKKMSKFLESPDQMKQMLLNLKALWINPELTTIAQDLYNSLIKDFILNKNELLTIIYESLDQEDKTAVIDNFKKLDTSRAIKKEDKIKFLALLIGMPPHKVQKTKTDADIRKIFKDQFAKTIMQNIGNKAKLKEIRDNLRTVLGLEVDGKDTAPSMFLVNSLEHQQAKELLALTQLLADEGENVSQETYNAFYFLKQGELADLIGEIDLTILNNTSTTLMELNNICSRLSQLEAGIMVKKGTISVRKESMRTLVSIFSLKAFIMSQELISKGENIPEEVDIRSLYTNIFSLTGIIPTMVPPQGLSDDEKLAFYRNLSTEQKLAMRKELKTAYDELVKKMLSSSISLKDMTKKSQFDNNILVLSKFYKQGIADLNQLLVSEGIDPESLAVDQEEALNITKEIELIPAEIKLLNTNILENICMRLGVDPTLAKGIIAELFQVNEKFRTLVFPFGFTAQDIDSIFTAIKAKAPSVDQTIFKTAVNEERKAHLDHLFNLRVLTKGLGLKLEDIPPDLLKERFAFFGPESSIKTIDDLTAKFLDEAKKPALLKSGDKPEKKLATILTSVYEDTKTDVFAGYQKLVIEKYLAVLIDEKVTAGFSEENKAKRSAVDEKIDGLISRLKELADKDRVGARDILEKIDETVKRIAEKPEQKLTALSLELSILDELSKTDSFSADAFVSKLKEDIEKALTADLPNIFKSVPLDQPARKDAIARIKFTILEILKHSNPGLDEKIISALQGSEVLEVRDLVKEFKTRIKLSKFLERLKGKDFEEKFTLTSEKELSLKIISENDELLKYLKTLNREDLLMFGKEYLSEIMTYIKKLNNEAKKGRTNFSEKNLMIVFSRMDLLLAQLPSLSKEEQKEYNEILAGFFKEYLELAKTKKEYLPKDSMSIKTLAKIIAQINPSFRDNDYLSILINQLGFRNFDSLFAEVAKLNPSMAKELKKIQNEKKRELLGSGFIKEVSLHERRINELMRELYQIESNLKGAKYTKLSEAEKEKLEIRKQEIIAKMNNYLADDRIDQGVKIELLRMILDRSPEQLAEFLKRISPDLKACFFLSYSATNGQVDKLIKFMNHNDKCLELVTDFFSERVSNINDDKRSTFEEQFFRKYHYLYEGEIHLSVLLSQVFSRLEVLNLQQLRQKIIKKIGKGRKSSIKLESKYGKPKAKPSTFISDLKEGYVFLAAFCPEILFSNSAVNLDIPRMFFGQQFRTMSDGTGKWRSPLGDSMRSSFRRVLAGLNQSYQQRKTAGKSKEFDEFKKQLTDNFLKPLVTGYTLQSGTREEIFYRQDLIKALVEVGPDMFLDLVNSLDDYTDMEKSEKFKQDLFLMVNRLFQGGLFGKVDDKFFHQRKTQYKALIDKMKADSKTSKYIAYLLVDVDDNTLRFNYKELAGLLGKSKFVDYLLQTEKVLGTKKFFELVFPLLEHYRSENIELIPKGKDTFERLQLFKKALSVLQQETALLKAKKDKEDELTKMKARHEEATPAYKTAEEELAKINQDITALQPQITAIKDKLTDKTNPITEVERSIDQLETEYEEIAEEIKKVLEETSLIDFKAFKKSEIAILKEIRKKETEIKQKNTALTDPTITAPSKRQLEAEITQLEIELEKLNASIEHNLVSKTLKEMPHDAVLITEYLEKVIEKYKKVNGLENIDSFLASLPIPDTMIDDKGQEITKQKLLEQISEKMDKASVTVKRDKIEIEQKLTLKDRLRQFRLTLSHRSVEEQIEIYHNQIDNFKHYFSRISRTQDYLLNEPSPR